MRTFCSVLLVAALAAAVVAPPASARTGVGLIAGEPTGISLKVWSDGGTAIDAATGWSFGDSGSFYAHADFLWHRIVEDEDIGGSVPVYFGVGGRVLLRDEKDSKLGVRFPIGLEYLFDDGRFGVFVEVAPIFDLVPKTDFDVSGGIGARFYF